MFRAMSVVLAAAFAATGASAVTMYQGEIKVQVDGKAIDFGQRGPVIVDDRVLVPLRGVFEHMGARIVWQPEQHKVTAVQGAKEVILFIGSNEAYIQGRAYQMDEPPSIINGRTMVPLRFLGEALGAEVQWEPQGRLVTIDTTPSS